VIDETNTTREPGSYLKDAQEEVRKNEEFVAEFADPAATQPPAPKKDEKKESLMTRMANFGSAIISEAQNKYDEARKDRILELVHGLMRQRDAFLKAQEEAQLKAEFCDIRLSAIKAGEFTIDKEGMLRFNDNDLNREWNTMPNASGQVIIDPHHPNFRSRF